MCGGMISQQEGSILDYLIQDNLLFFVLNIQLIYSTLFKILVIKLALIDGLQICPIF